MKPAILVVGFFLVAGAPPWRAMAANDPRNAALGAGQDALSGSSAPTLRAASGGDLKSPSRVSWDAYGADPTGASDSTSAIQAAIDSGRSLACNGVYKISATLNLAGAANHGQQIAGAGATDGGGVATAGRCVIRPTRAVSIAVKIDGRGFGGYVQGAGFANLTLDMADMAPSSKGFEQLQAYDIHYDQVRVTNDIGKWSWFFGPGAYTTELRNVQGALVDCHGTGVNNPTTITLVNPDINGLDVEQCANVTSLGGAIQPRYSPSNAIIYLDPGIYPLGFGKNLAGMYLSISAQVFDAQYLTTVGTDWEALTQPPPTCAVMGWAFGTFNDGTHGCHPIVMAVQLGRSVQNISLINPTFANMYLYNLSGSDGNVTVTGYQTEGGIGNYHFGGETFDASVYLNNAQALYGYSDDRSIQTLLLDASIGRIQGRQFKITPASDGADAVVGFNAAGTPLFHFSTNATPASSTWNFAQGMKTIWYSDSHKKRKAEVDGATGLAIFSSVLTPAVTIAGLPTPPAAGQRGFVIDAATCVFNRAVSGGGSVRCPVVYNGSSWVGG